jgi:hypothetical protein
MPEQIESWIQDDWSSGGGQDLWNNNSKYDSSENINDTSAGGPLRLGEGEDVDVWEQAFDGFGGRYRHRMVWNPTRKVFYSFGGVAGSSNVVNELYEYNPVNGLWTQKGQSGGPSARCAAQVVYDKINNLLWVYGGRDRANPGGNQFNDLWSYNPNTDSWTQKVDGPGARSDAVAVFNTITREIIVYGGYIGGTEFSSNQVHVYNTQTNLWKMKHNYTKRYYHGGVWSPYTNSMFVYGGAERWSGDFTYVNELNEYFPGNDTWINRTPVGNRVRSLLVWDTLNDQLILQGGGEPDRNDTWVYDTDTDTWTAMSNGPAPPRDRVGGDWDTVRNELVTFGGTINQQRNAEVWIYSPTVTGYLRSGELISSVFDAGGKVNPKSVSFEIEKPAPPGIGGAQVKIQLAGSDTSAGNANSFIGPNGYGTTFFTQETGSSVPSKLESSRYIAYKLNISSTDPRRTTELNWIKIDYFTYPDNYVFESGIFDIGTDFGLPLRNVEWISDEPDGTGFKVYFRQAQIQMDISTISWEEVVLDQSTFDYDKGKYFQYKIEFTTTDTSQSAELSEITFTFNNPPSKPKLIYPGDGKWVGDSKPLLRWEFNDTDSGDHQTGLEVLIGLDDTYTFLKYSSNTIDSNNNSFEITEDLGEGEYYWKVKLRDNYGSWSPWSDTNFMIVDTGKPSGFAIDSYSHPLEHIWYSTNKVSLYWNEPNDPSGIAGYSYVFDPSPTAEPVNNIMMTDEEFRFAYNASDFTGLVTFDHVSDGIWYFHLKAVDNLDTWSDTVTRMVRVDTSTPEVVDYTPNKVLAGSELIFRFALNDSYSGINLPTISWRYALDLDFQYEELSHIGGDNYSLTHKVKLTTDPHIEYYIEVSDFSEPGNILRFPDPVYKKVALIDSEPPVITETTGSKTHNQFANLEIFVKATDNVGIFEAKIFFNDQSTGMAMTKAAGNTFTFNIDRVELLDYSGYTDNNSILYKVKVWDHHNNSAGAPDSGNFLIKIEDIDDTKQDSKDEEKDEGFSQSLLLYLLIMVVIVVVVFMVLFMFIKKSKEDIDDDRHKLRMAIADVQEAASGGGAPLAAPPTGISPSPGSPPGQLPTPDSQTGPVGYLPEAQPEPQSQPDEYSDYKKAGLLAPEQSAAPSAEPDKPKVLDLPDEKSPTTKKGSKVDIDDGLSISLPDDK